MPKAETRNSTQRSRTSSPDPILKLIKEADIRLADLRRAAEERAAIIEKIGKDTTGRSYLDRAPIQGPLTFHRMFYTYTFDGLGSFMKACRRAASQSKTAIKGERSSLKSGRLNPHQDLIARQNILEARATLAQVPLVEAWGQREWRREAARLDRLQRTSGYRKANARYTDAYFAARDAVTRVSAAKPKTAEGCLALVKLVADRHMQDNALGVKDISAEICAPLYRAHDVLKMFEMGRAAR